MPNAIAGNARLALFSFGLAAAAGCAGRPAGIAPPEMDPAEIAQRAISEYDANSDQKLSKEELKNCRGLTSAFVRFDQDNDGAISSGELTTLFQEIDKQGAGLVAVTCNVTHNHRPLAGAVVTFTPESFMGDAIQPASGITADDGTTFPSIPDEAIPQEYRGRLHGLRCGVYRVEVTHPSAKIPAKFNQQTEIGRLVTRRDHEMLTVNF